MITVNENGVRNINASLLSLDSDIKTTKKGLLSKIEALQETVDGMSGGETNLTPGSTYDINITGNASTATNATTADTASQVAGILTLSKTSTKTNETTSDTSFNGLVSVSNKIYSPDQSVNKSDNVTFKSVNYSEENVVTYSMASSVTMPSTDVIYKGIKLTGALTADATLTLYFNSTTLVGRKSWHILNECTTLLFPEQTITITTNSGTSTTISVKKNQASYVTDVYVDSSGNVLPFASTRASSSDSLKNPLTISSTALSSAMSYNGSYAVKIYSPSQLVDANSSPAHNSLKLTSGADVTTTYSADDPLVIGTSTGTNIALDNNEIMARNNNAVAPLYLNDQGGPVVVNLSASGRTDSFLQSKSTVIIDPLNLPAGGYDEGLRINKATTGYSTIALGGNTNSQSGIQDGAWWIGCNYTDYGRKLYISHNSSTSPGNAYFYADSASSGTSGLVIPNVIGLASNASNVVPNSYTSGASSSYTISTFLTKLVSLGIITAGQMYSKPFMFTWAYANNGVLTGLPNGESANLAGASCTFVGRYTTDPTTSGENNNYFDLTINTSCHSVVGTANSTYIYTCRSGSGYGPKWRKVITSENIGSQSVSSAATCTGNASSASHLLINGVTYDSNWYWNGQSGQPSWLWGSNDGTNMYVWNPSNFSVSYASTSETANKIRTSSPGSPANGDIWMV